MCGGITITDSSLLDRIALPKPINQASKFQQVHHTEKRPPLTHDDLGIRSDQIRPLRRNRANRSNLGFKQQSHPIAVVSLAHANQLLTTQWMERMRHPYKTRCCNRSICTLD